MKFAFLFFALIAAVFADEVPAIAPAPGGAGWHYEELRRLPAAEAGQGVVADAEFLYAINNHAIGKYRKASGERVALWEGGVGGEVIHLNAGIVYEGRLYCAHSNFPAVPMLCSVEIFDLASLTHVDSHSFGHVDGSLTWIDRHEGKWIACFVNYGKKGGEPGRGPEWTQIVEFDNHWQRTRAWGLPANLVARIGEKGFSLSGGAFGPKNLLYATGHDNAELYVLDFPKAGSILKWIATLPITAEGQSFGWDPKETGLLYSIGRKSREIIVGRVSAP